MNATTNIFNRCLKPISSLTLAALIVATAAGCKTTRQITQDVEPSGFLGDYSQLEKGVKNRAVYSYINTNVNWGKFTKIMIKPIELWASSDPDTKIGSLSDENKQKLIDLLHTALNEHLTKAGYQMVDQAGPDVLVIHAAITDMKKSKPVIGFVSSVYLPLKVIGLGKQLITGTTIGVGAITVEAEFIDGSNNQRIAAIVDRRGGTGAIRSKFASSWGDIERCDNWWAERLVERLQAAKEAKK